VDRRRQPALMVMPDELPAPMEHLLNRREGGGSIHCGFEPLPEALDRMILGGIRLQVFQLNPRVSLEKAFDGSAFVQLGIVEEHDAQRLGEPLMELVEAGQKDLGRPPLGPFPIEALGPQMEGAEQRGALTLPGRGHFDLYACAKPSALDVGFIGTVRLIDPHAFYGAFRLPGVDGGDNFCHPGLFFAGLGTLRGTVVAQRLSTQPPACNWRRTVASLTSPVVGAS
jgi:hypothetical protein